jgi:hypothetical protein
LRGRGFRKDSKSSPNLDTAVVTRHYTE